MVVMRESYMKMLVGVESDFLYLEIYDGVSAPQGRDERKYGC